MADLTRRYQFTRRNKSIADMGQKNMTTGKFTLAELRNDPLWKINSIHQIGIATTAEIGLSPNRWPCRVKLSAVSEYNPVAETVCKSWPIVLANNNAVPFTYMAQFNEERLGRLYKWYPNIDAALWQVWHAIRGAVNAEAYPADIGILQTHVSTGLAVPNPTAEQRTQFLAHLLEFLTACRAQHRVPKIPIADGYYLLGKPHGVGDIGLQTLPAEFVPQVEAALTAQLNFNRLKDRYPTISDGTVTMCAYAIANMFRLGLYEQAGGAEYYTVHMAPGAGTTYTVTGVTKPAPAPEITGLAIGYAIDTATIMVDPSFAEVGSAFVAMSGVMHYSYNHTTGGSVLGGPVLAMALSFGLFDGQAEMAAQELQTNLYYEALHPSNKRLIANLLFKNTGILTAGRHAGAPISAELNVDSFVAIRTNPFPAGAHKAYVAGEVLKRILSANLAPFLPWANEINNCVNACRDIINVGARAHIGSRYYTGFAPTTQGSNLDNYIPDLAAYIQTMAKNDTLAMSPHLSGANAARGSPSWVALLKELKSNDISGADINMVKAYLQSAGQFAFSLNPADESTWAGSIEECRGALAILGGLLN